jgi:hypothetical protein
MWYYIAALIVAGFAVAGYLLSARLAPEPSARDWARDEAGRGIRKLEELLELEAAARERD